MPAPASSTNDAAICVDGEQREAAVGARVMRTPPLAAEPVDASDDGSRGTNASRTAAASARPTPTHSSVASTVRSSARDGETRRVARQDRDHRPRDQHAEIAPAPQSSRLSASSVRRSAQRLAPSAARIASSPSRRTERAEDQVGDVRARDDEDQRRGREQHQQHRPRGRRDLFAQLHGVDLEVAVLRIRLGMRRTIGRDRAQLGAGRVESAPGASRPNSSVIRCTRPSRIVADR
jgi:hypothetical protein